MVQPVSRNNKAPLIRGFSGVLPVGAKDMRGPELPGGIPSPPLFSATAARPAAGVALHAGAVADQRVVAAFAAGVALIALHLGLGAAVHAHHTRGYCRA